MTPLAPEIVLLALDAVASASRVCRHVQARLADLRALTKDDQSPVTIADLASQAIVAHALEARSLETHTVPRVILVAEETSALLRDPEHRALLQACLEAARLEWPGVTADELLHAIDLGAGDPLSPAARERGFWTLDPIDGTKGFLRGEQFAVALAFVQQGRPVLGVLGCPNLPEGQGCLQCADEDGAFEILGLDAQGPRRATGTRDRLQSGLSAEGAEARPLVLARSVEAAHSSKGHTDAVMEAAGLPWSSIFMDSQAKYAAVARGDADMYLRMPVKKDYIERIWDHAAGALIAERSGAKVTDAAGKPLDFSKGRGLEANRGVLVAPPKVHALLVHAIRSIFSTRA
jgi:3'(2'), 5'-bisphosphate nucleotidase